MDELTLTPDEQKKVKRWILSCADPDVIQRMQNNTQKLNCLWEEHFAKPGRVQRYENSDDGEPIPFQTKALEQF